MLRGLTALQRRLVPQKLDLAPTPWMDGPSPKVDQHEPSHSRMHYT
jgi:hypothetical protein